MVGIFGAVIFFAAIAFYSKGADGLASLDNGIKILIIAALSAAFLGLGIIFPVLRYKKRKATGTLAPIRLPEPKEPAESDEPVEDPNRPLTLEEKIAAMSREIDENKGTDQDDK